MNDVPLPRRFRRMWAGYTGRQTKACMGLVGIPILFISLTYGPGAIVLEAGTVLATGLAGGAMLVAGLARRGAPGKRFLGTCMILVGSSFLCAFFLDKIPEQYPELGLERVFNFYYTMFVLFGPVLCPSLLVLGYRVFPGRRLAGACMMVIGAGCLPGAAFLALVGVAASLMTSGAPHALGDIYSDAAYSDLLWLGDHAVPAVGSILVLLGIAMAGRTPRSCR